jgi:hypothetical protein
MQDIPTGALLMKCSRRLYSYFIQYNKSDRTRFGVKLNKPFLIKRVVIVIPSKLYVVNTMQMTHLPVQKLLLTR